MQTSVQSERLVYLGVMGPLMLAIVTLLALCMIGFEVLSSVRAYVGGESLWSKARSNAVAHLRAHAASGTQAEYRRFLESLAVPLGDRAARLELENRQFDEVAARNGFLAGENELEDIPGMIRLYRYFRHVEFMEEAVSAWVEGDRLIERLQDLGLRIHLHVQRSDSRAVLTPLMIELDTLDGQLVNVEKYFSATLGSASRKTRQLLLYVTLTLAALLALGGAIFVRYVMRMQLADRQLLIEVNQRFELGADAAGIGLFDWHLAGDRFEMDERACALYGVEYKDGGISFKRTEMRAMTHPDDQAQVRGELDRAVSTGGVLKTRYRVLLTNGGVRYVEAIGRVHDAEDALRARMIGVLRDVGGEVTQAQLAVDKESAERGARLRVEFLSRLSHELRTPLNAVLGVAQLLRIDPTEPLSVNQAKRVQILEESGTHLLSLVEDVFDISRIDSGALTLHKVPTDMLTVLRTGLNIVEPERAAYQIRIDDRMPYKESIVLADPQRLQQVFVNLLSNACRYNTSGGRLSLQFGEDSCFCWISIADEGAGMTEAQMGELFEPFKRLPASNEVSGTGLGLVVVKLLVEQMHGTVSVESKTGHGSIFTVRMQRPS